MSYSFRGDILCFIRVFSFINLLIINLKAVKENIRELKNTTFLRLFSDFEESKRDEV